MARTLRQKAWFGWCMYDWANSAYATTVMAGFFPVFFKQYWASGLPVNESTFWLGVANSVAAVLMALPDRQATRLVVILQPASSAKKPSGTAVLSGKIAS